MYYINPGMPCPEAEIFNLKARSLDVATRVLGLPTQGLELEN